MRQYHILVSGFELSKPNRDDAKSPNKVTDLRHYRYDVTSYSLQADNGSWVVKEGKEFKAAFPVSNTMILVEDVEDKQ